jgi:hypothetical protein
MMSVLVISEHNKAYTLAFDKRSSISAKRKGERVVAVTKEPVRRRRNRHQQIARVVRQTADKFVRGKNDKNYELPADRWKNLQDGWQIP